MCAGSAETVGVGAGWGWSLVVSPNRSLGNSLCVLHPIGNSRRSLCPNASPHVPRRRFLKNTVAAAAAAIMAPTIIPGSASGAMVRLLPSERVVVGGIGIGNRGTYDLGCFLEQPDVQFIAVCDVKEARRVAVKKIADEKYGNQDCSMHRDFRELLDRKDIDAVLIATGPNWHATMAIEAAKAGKDMYCEKPCTKNISQSLILAETMRRTGRVFQAGTQRRNLPHFAFACQLGSHRQARKTHERSLHIRPECRP